ncbi:hypothetical protein [Desulfuromonas acetoxidans]|uniref:hypothetical protein n=1 Tax=Desulfuromonas acetoxidans TaxID=891 RepID=UPI0012DE0433|nr:hypothetical protein [Desulfuromonas acetoxidans]MBF0645267.1 hypothetical protein [Desulfuromonas acetoxidans]NVD25573.1 hypothetical protein [Desulfuromonas acetoxidans]NVE17617.1 hypothetical protein [Desulfuromonas acetoxidans]
MLFAITILLKSDAYKGEGSNKRDINEILNSDPAIVEIYCDRLGLFFVSINGLLDFFVMKQARQSSEMCFALLFIEKLL